MPHRVAQDYSGADEANTRQDSLDKPTDGVQVYRRKPGLGAAAYERRNRSSNANQRMRAQARRFPVELAIQSENGTDNERGSEAQNCLFSPAQHSTMLC